MADQEVKMTKVELPDGQDKFAVVIDNVLSKEECEHLIEMTEKQGYDAALLNVGDSV